MASFSGLNLAEKIGQEELSLSKESLLNLTMLVCEALNEKNGMFEDVSSVYYTTGDLENGLLVFNVFEKRRYSLKQVNIIEQEQVRMNLQAWEIVQDLLDKALIMDQRDKATVQAFTVYELLNYTIKGSILQYIRDMGYRVMKNPNVDTSKIRQILVKFFHGAIKHNLECIVDWCLKQDIGVNEVLQDKCALYVAVGSKNTSILRKILSRSSRVNKLMGKSCQTPLHLAVHLQYSQGVKLLLQSNADITLRDIHGHSVLSRVVEKAESTGFLEMFFRETGGNVNICDEKGFTALHLAVAHNRADFLDFLISKGADLEATCTCGNTPLMMAACGKQEMFQKLLRLGASLFRVNYGGQNALHLVAMANKPSPSLGSLIADCKKIVNALVERGVDVNAADWGGQTPLHLAFPSSNNVRETLLAHGAQVELRNNQGKTVIDMFHDTIINKKPNIRKEWVRVLAKLKMAGVRDLTVEFGVTDEELRVICTLCQEELNLMRQTRIIGNVSLYQVMVCSTPDPNYSVLTNLKIHVRGDGLIDLYPIYYLNIRDSYETTYMRNSLLTERLITKFSNIATNIPPEGLTLPLEVSRMILSQLCFPTLLRLHEVFEITPDLTTSLLTEELITRFSNIRSNILPQGELLTLPFEVCRMILSQLSIPVLESLHEAFGLMPISHNYDDFIDCV